MRAIVLNGPRSVSQVEVEFPTPGPGEVLLRMLGVGICGSDLSVFYGHRQVPYYPWQMGHEGVGEVVGFGGDVSHLKIGDRVVLEPNYCCFSCSECFKGNTSGCLNRVIVGMAVPGILADYVVVPAPFAWKAPKDLSVGELIALEPFTVGVAALRRSNIQSGDRALVVGMGSTGLLLAGLLISRGFDTYFVEVSSERAALAATLGASSYSALEPSSFERVFETSGSSGGFEIALKSAASGGTIVLIGLSSEPVEVVPADLVRRRLSLVGSMIYDHPTDFATTMAAQPNFLRSVVQARFSFDKAQDAFESAHAVPGKSWISVVEERESL
ncbi:zinc-dependent alcohol dehydrogenase [Acidithrix ferrooxidans]|uniref:Putative zinc-type alcohol dehydrogenase-like protein YjmD n=1 Tax=Acidithrix ferrooxidans TaxID=1280514 RepID=A0A0D8HI45_9ACTN|nr:alcohol dehydrogenase catalytic domain-containing protein [Acidithrix ferrooxidans]KJF17427.1 putative zinc-type alcohol dehydrogenase-like protein YjmD [Acidithrix ferrooxidans]